MIRRMCLYHPDKPAARRGVCWGCCKKFRGAGVPLPPMASPGPAPWTPAERLSAWARSLSPEARAALVGALLGSVSSSPTITPAEAP